MQLEIFHTDTYKELSQTHLFNTISFLLDEGVEFSLAVELRHITFEPVLPSSIMEEFGDVVLFVMAGYTFETLQLDDTDLYFEAGFGAEAIGSRLSLPLLSIKQLFVEEYPIAINITEPFRLKATQTQPKRSPDHSMEALLNNPKNKKLLQKSKK